MYKESIHFALVFFSVLLRATRLVFLSREHSSRSQVGLLTGQKDCVTILNNTGYQGVFDIYFRLLLLFFTVSH